MFRDTKCSSSQKVDNVYFYLGNSAGPVTSAVAGQLISNFGGDAYYSQFSASTGQGWIVFENLPAGQFNLNIGKFDGSDYS